MVELVWLAELEFATLLYGLIVGLGAGMIGGLLAALAGVGGGLIYVPLFYALMPSNSESIAIDVFASLVAIVATGHFAARSHLRLGHVDKEAVFRLLPGLIAGAALGLWSTLQLSQLWILLGLAGLNAWVAFDYGSFHRKEKSKSVRVMTLTSMPIGYVSGVLGIGGGTMLVPMLRRFVDLRHAVGSSAMCGFMMALGALLVNLWIQPEWSELIFLHGQFLFPAWLGMVSVLPLASKQAALVHQCVAEETLRYILKLIFMLLSAGLLLAALLSIS